MVSLLLNNPRSFNQGVRFPNEHFVLRDIEFPQISISKGVSIFAAATRLTKILITFGQTFEPREALYRGNALPPLPPR